MQRNQTFCRTTNLALPFCQPLSSFRFMNLANSSSVFWTNQMNLTHRKVRGWRTFFGALLVVSQLGCVSIKTAPSVSVWSYEKTTRIGISVPTKGTEFNVHYVGWVSVLDDYELRIPRGLASASADQIELKHRTKDGNITLKVGSDSVVTITGNADCAVELQINDETGHAFKFNGTYTNLLCYR
jgi:hypothetical protein